MDSSILKARAAQEKWTADSLTDKDELYKLALTYIKTPDNNNREDFNLVVSAYANLHALYVRHLLLESKQQSEDAIKSARSELANASQKERVAAEAALNILNNEKTEVQQAANGYLAAVKELLTKAASPDMLRTN